MKKFSSVLILLIIASIIWLPLPGEAAVSGWQKGMSIYPRWDTDFSSETFKESVRNIAATKANYVTLIIPYYQSNIYSTDLQRGWNTPTDQSVVDAINFIHSLGMKVNLKPHAETNDGQWRAYINPGDRSGWFAAYEVLLNRYATIGKNNGVEMITLGSELISMATYTVNPDNTARWNGMIGRMRTQYPGLLTYSANWGSGGFADEKNHIAFWGSLDYVGIAAYFPLNSDASVASLKGQWDYWKNSGIEPLSRQYGKQILFTEIGYRSVSGARYAPFDSWSGGPYDGTEQANLYEALFSYWNDHGFMAGVHIWDWVSDPNAGWPGSISYTPQHKPAEQVITTWFGSGGDSPPPPPPSGSASFESSLEILPALPKTNESATLSANARNTSQSSSSGIIVDLEIYDGGGGKTFQKFFESQTFGAGEIKPFSALWTPGAPGTYSAAVGIFNSSWTANYLWKTVGFTVSDTAPPPPPPPPSSLSFDGTITSTPENPPEGEQAALSASVKNTGSPSLSGITVDIEVYDSQNQKVLQHFFEGQVFEGGETKNFTLPWTPQSPGKYTLALGVFNSSWTVNYLWKTAPAEVGSSGGGGLPPPPSSGSIQVWWPGEGSHVSGVQPFKMILEGSSLSQYLGYWQVDGGVLNQMGDSSEGYPHKESLVDLSPWTWKGEGSYLVNFLAKDSAGGILDEKGINIFIP